jgi:hypothetical protein
MNRGAFDEFMAQVSEDERVMASSLVAMDSADEMTAAVYRLTGQFGFPRKVAQMVIAHRRRDSALFSQLCHEIMFDIETEVMEHCRRQVASTH